MRAQDIFDQFPSSQTEQEVELKYQILCECISLATCGRKQMRRRYYRRIRELRAKLTAAVIARQ